MYEVLIVEDDPMVAMINKQYVAQSQAFRVAGVVRDGLSALDFIKKNKVDLMILDQYMPRMSGIEVLRELRRQEYPVSVIVVTAANDGSTIEEALRLGIVDYLVKPFTSQRFIQALNYFIDRQSTFSQEGNFSQKSIDELIRSSNRRDENSLPKGIQEVTLECFREFLKREASSKELTSDEISEGVEVSRVTVRRYMNYLIESGEVTGRMNYETGGRPSMLYIWNET